MQRCAVQDYRCCLLAARQGTCSEVHVRCACRVHCGCFWSSEYWRAWYPDDPEDLSLCRCGQHECDAWCAAYQGDHQCCQEHLHPHHHGMVKQEAASMMKSDCEPFRSEDLCGQPKQAVASVLVWSRHGCLGRAFLLTDCTNMLPA